MRHNRIFIIFCFFVIINGCSQKADEVKEDVKHERIEQSVEKPSLSQGLSKRGDPERGKVIYKRYCFYCHGKEGRGDGAIGIALNPRPADFVNDVERMAKSDEALFVSISEGVRGREEPAIVMPAWKAILTEEERWDVLAYVRYLSEKGDNS